MTDAEIAKLRALADAATPGPWTLDLDRNEQQNIYAELPSHREWIAILPHQCVRSIEGQRSADAAFIAAARSAVPQLLGECERLRARQSELLALVAKLSQTVPLESEVAEALNQRGALLAEVGTLRGRVAAAEKDRDAYRAMLADLVAARSQTDAEAREQWARARDLLKNGPKPAGGPDAR